MQIDDIHPIGKNGSLEVVLQDGGFLASQGAPRIDRQVEIGALVRRPLRSRAEYPRLATRGQAAIENVADDREVIWTNVERRRHSRFGVATFQLRQQRP